MLEPKSTHIAHVHSTNGQIQSVQTHLFETAEIAKQFTAKIGLSSAGELMGLMHDFGKYSQDFQGYIRNATGIDPDADNDCELPNGKKIDHSTAGAQWVYRALRKFGTAQGIGELLGQILGLCIASHHGKGLIDCLDTNAEMVLAKRFAKADELTHLAECKKTADPDVMQQAEHLANEPLIRDFIQILKPILSDKTTSQKVKEFYLGALTKFLFSCLIDADRINSADFEKNHQKPIRRLTVQPDWQEAINKLENNLAHFEIRYPIDEIRRRISDNCLQRAQDAQGIYSLTVPTGGGKTLASLRYALHHAQKHDLDRIIYIIPYTSIIDQNAQAVREILGEDWVLEQHSNLEPDEQSWQDKLLSENWDKPIVFTTMVQFLEAWFAGGTRSVRHLHPMSNAVLIFDEIQTLPIKCVHLFCNALNWLTQFGKSTAVLCTATQPLLGEGNLARFPANQREKMTARGLLKLAENSELMGENQALEQLFEDLSRVEVRFNEKLGGWALDDAGAFLLEQFKTTSSCLFIVNTKQWAQDLYQYCKAQDVPAEALFHLSTHQCAAHRKAILARIKSRLKNKEPVICISTQLIEAGVDISMGCVIRALAGLDSIAQAAGRCNRHGEVKKGLVWVLNLQEQNFQKVLPDIEYGKECAQRVFREFAGQDILQVAAMERYFQYYFYQRSQEMVYPIKESRTGSLLDWLSDNKQNHYSEKNDRRTKPIPLLMQSFKSAGQAFQAIEAPTKSLIVPYGEGVALIARLCGEWDLQEMARALQQAQRYSINVFPNVWEKLQKEKAIYETIENSGIYYLDERYYHEEYGLSLDETAEMTFYEL